MLRFSEKILMYDLVSVRSRNFSQTPSPLSLSRSPLPLVLPSIAYFSPSWTAFQADRGRDFSVIVDGVSV